MGWLLKVMLYDNFTGIKLFNLISFGVVHPSNNVKGLMFGLWRVQFQINVAIEEKLQIEGEGYA
tara:strand:+ start:1531 stop:1722 length:192 start_codon:yes stop_codon:yes gene_type:complete